jgi:hypothetical protein
LAFLRDRYVAEASIILGFGGRAQEFGKVGAGAARLFLLFVSSPYYLSPCLARASSSTPSWSE